MSAPAPRRLAVVLSHPTQYYSPWFRWIAAHAPVNFRVFYLWKFGVSMQRDPLFKTEFAWDVDLLSGYESEFVPNAARRPGAESFWGFHNPGLFRRLEAWSPGALLLFGYKWRTHLRTIGWARRRGVPIIFRGDSHFIGRPGPGWTRFLLMKRVFRRFRAVTYVGAANREYFETLGVPRDRLFFAPHAVDDTLFNSNDARHRAAAAELRTQLGLPPSRRVVLFAGKLIPAKQPRELLEAFLAARHPNASLVFVGAGDEKTALESIAADGPAGAVHFLPFANQSEMPARYLLADIFALPSRGHYETWGVAVNEAMHMGVPCLVSDRVGCQRDLVTDGETGWVYSAMDAKGLQEKLKAALVAVDADSERERLRGAVMKRIAGYTYAQATDGLMAALASVTS